MLRRSASSAVARHPPDPVAKRGFFSQSRQIYFGEGSAQATLIVIDRFAQPEQCLIDVLRQCSAD
jgi:hypothetical protein